METKIFEIDLEIKDTLERTNAEMTVYLRGLLKDVNIHFLSIRVKKELSENAKEYINRELRK